MAIKPEDVIAALVAKGGRFVASDGLQLNLLPTGDDYEIVGTGSGGAYTIRQAREATEELLND